MTIHANPPDVLIVGAGASGAVVAKQLATAGLSVVCLEQGQWVDPADFPGERLDWEAYASRRWNADPNVRARPEDYPIEVSQADVTPLNFNGVGGSTILYGGQWVRLLPSDFHVATTDGLADDWPFGYAELAPYYARLERELGIAGMTGDPAYPDDIEYAVPPHRLGPWGKVAAKGLTALGWHWWPHPMAIPTRDHGHLRACVRRGQCEVGCPEQAKVTTDVSHWPDAIASGARLVTGARAREVAVDARGRATGVAYLDREGNEHFQAAKRVVLAASAVGSARLLLMSTSTLFPDGLANSTGLVGKRLMMHPGIMVAGVYDEPLETWRGPSGGPILSLQFYETDESRGFPRGAKWEPQNIAGPAGAASRLEHLPFGERFGPAFHERLAGFFNHAFDWFAISEDLPEETNTVSLDPELTDSDGLPAPRVHYRVSEWSRRNLDYQAERMREAHEAAGATETFVTEVPDVGWHMLGTARCGQDPATSVVDPWGRAHDVPNLHIVDGSVFVTGGAANPAATIMAFAGRAADHILATGHHDSGGRR